MRRRRGHQALSRTRVIIDGRIVDNPAVVDSGIGRYTIEVSRAIARARPGWEVVVLSNRADLFDGCATWPTRWPTTSSLGRLSWVHVVSGIELRWRGGDIWFGPTFVVPRWWRGPSVVTVLDLVFRTIPERYRGRLNARHASWATRESVRRAAQTICISQATKDDLIDFVGPVGQRAVVIHLGVGAHFTPRATAVKRHLLFVGTWEARKGLDTLTDVVALLRGRGVDVPVLVAGRPGWGTGESVVRLKSLGVRFVEGADDADLVALYQDAIALLMLSRAEGFGLTVAEAMACGTAVIASDLPSVREFAADGAAYVQVANADAVVERVERFLADPDERRILERRGLRVSETLRWPIVGERHAKVLESALTARATDRLIYRP